MVSNDDAINNNGSRNEAFGWKCHRHVWKQQRNEEGFITGFSEPLEEFFGANPSPRIHAKLHFRDLLVDLFHEMNDKVDEFVSVHLLGVKIGDQETDIVPLDFFPPQDHKVFGSSHHEAHKLMAQKFLDLIGLLDGDGYPNRVDRWLDQNPFLLISRNNHRI